MPTFVQGRPVRRLPELTDEIRRGTPLRITEYGEEILHRPCREVTEFGAERWAGIVDNLFTTMWIAEGCGLAANQVDLDARLFVYDLTDEDGVRHLGHAFNPRVEAASGFFGDEDASEGCLSVPGARAPLARPARATLHAFDLDGRPFTLEAAGYFARCLIHETQHLDGTLYVDHLTPADRERALAESAVRRDEVFEERAARQQLLGK
ncbi:peptide deformylase [Kribbella amoyensis]|uniref:Peptide deformylase n=1 Tax=Kribbella amoyensis TaxID=996641 RepID=A0A561BWX9_9ACTN|nr:peptide deformylase [Kribbella amoyensis]TWD83347.1 peptide deformylase [Kribbella amoyensis]